MKKAAVLALALQCAACVSGSKIRADSDVIKADLERARRGGAMRCAPRELATAEANLDFALGELSEGSSFRAAEHIRDAETATRKVLALSRECGPKQVLIKELPVEKPLVVKIEEVDRDGDGLLDKDDGCPDMPEDKDGFKDEDGCPDPDNDLDTVYDEEDGCPLVPGPPANRGCPVTQAKDQDGDGIPDDLDRCPEDPEDPDGFKDEDGCPDLDNDGDGLLDAADKCPNEAGPIQNVGCPVKDRDGDGIPDDSDKCPDEPEDLDGFQDDDGCPDLDNDQDGIPDAQDQCPNEPGVTEEKGCPKKYKLVVVKKDRIEIKRQIKFATGSARILGKDSFEILGEVAMALKDNPQIKVLRVEGHTDSVGNDAANLKLSQDRARSVMAALIHVGVDPGRMTAVGYGETKAIASNSTAAGRQENRRTEFNILEQ